MREQGHDAVTRTFTWVGSSAASSGWTAGSARPWWVTHGFRRIDGTWWLTHRQADFPPPDPRTR